MAQNPTHVSDSRHTSKTGALSTPSVTPHAELFVSVAGYLAQGILLQSKPAATLHQCHPPVPLASVACRQLRYPFDLFKYSRATFFIADGYVWISSVISLPNEQDATLFVHLEPSRTAGSLNNVFFSGNRRHDICCCKRL